MSQPTSQNNQEKKSASDHQFYLPNYQSQGDYYSEISDSDSVDEEKPEKDSGDWDSFGDLILFI